MVPHKSLFDTSLKIIGQTRVKRRAEGRTIKNRETVRDGWQDLQVSKSGKLSGNSAGQSVAAQSPANVRLPWVFWLAPQSAIIALPLPLTEHSEEGIMVVLLTLSIHIPLIDGSQWQRREQWKLWELTGTWGWRGWRGRKGWGQWGCCGTGLSSQAS